MEYVTMNFGFWIVVLLSPPLCQLLFLSTRIHFAHFCYGITPLLGLRALRCRLWMRIISFRIVCLNIL
jgi:hypothetical protein